MQPQNLPPTPPVGGERTSSVSEQGSDVRPSVGSAQSAVNGDSSPNSSSQKKVLVIVACIVVGLLLVGGATYFVLSGNSSSQEQLAYEILENNDNPQDYKAFLEKYPNSEHSDDVRLRLEKLEAMIAKWNSIALSDNVNDFISFKNTYSEAQQYTRLCDIKIDSLDFVTAQRLGTNEAYQRYLDVHPSGRYASEASLAQGSLRDQEVSDEARQQIVMVLTDFYNGFSEQDESKICSNISSIMSTFLHKQNVSKSAVLTTIHNMFNEHIQACQFYVNRDLEITRQSDGSCSGVYVVTFTVDQHIERDNEGKTFGQYKCKAMVSEQMLITSLTMDEISQ